MKDLSTMRVHSVVLLVCERQMKAYEREWLDIDKSRASVPLMWC